MARTGAMLRASHEAWRNDVTINMIAPGSVRAIESLEEAIELCELGAKWHGRDNMTPQDIAEGVAWLCSESGRFVTGCEMHYMVFRIGA